jgi:hypothetical protein
MCYQWDGIDYSTSSCCVRCARTGSLEPGLNRECGQIEFGGVAEGGIGPGCGCELQRIVSDSLRRRCCAGDTSVTGLTGSIDGSYSVTIFRGRRQPAILIGGHACRRGGQQSIGTRRTGGGAFDLKAGLIA